MEPSKPEFSAVTNIKKAATFLATSAVAWLSAHYGMDLSAGQEAALAGLIGGALTSLRNWVKFRWPGRFGFL